MQNERKPQQARIVETQDSNSYPMLKQFGDSQTWIPGYPLAH